MEIDLQKSLLPFTKYFPHLPSPKQRQFLKYTCTEALYGGAAGGGKSDALLLGALQGISIPNYSAILFRKTYQDLALSNALMDRSHQWWAKTDAHWSADNKTWTFPSGARITFGYMDSAKDHFRYQSAEFQYVGFDECSHFPQEQVLYMISRLRAPKDFPSWLPFRLHSASNPGGIGHEWIQKRYGIPTEGTRKILKQCDANGNLVRVFVPAFAEDNPGLDVQEYHKKLALLDPLTRAQLQEGKWIIDSTGLVYYCYNNLCNVDQLPPLIPAKEWRYVLGCDWGATNDACAFAVCAYSPHEKEVYLVHTEEHNRMSPSDAARCVNELSEKFLGFESIVGDAATAGYNLELQKHFAIPIHNAEKREKLGYIKLFNGQLANGLLKVIPAECESWVKQARNLIWSPTQKNKEHQSLHNDSTDAALYAWRACRNYSQHERILDPTEEWLEKKAKVDPEGAEWLREIIEEKRMKDWEASEFGGGDPWL